MKKIMALILLTISTSLFAVETIVVEKQDFIKLTEISDEYTELAKKKKIQTTATVVNKTQIEVTIIVAKDMRFVNDMIYKSRMEFNAEIEKIDDDGETFIIKFKPETIGNVSNGGVKNFLKGMFTGIGVGSIITIIIALAI